MISWWAEQISSWGTAWGESPQGALEKVALLLGSLVMLLFFPQCGFFMPHRLGIAGLVRLLPWKARGFMVLALLQSLLVAAIALTMLAAPLIPAPPGPPSHSDTGKSAPPSAPVVAGFMLVMPGMLWFGIGLGTLTGQPSRRLTCRGDRGALEQGYRDLSAWLPRQGWNVVEEWCPRAGTRICWLGQAMSTSTAMSGEAALAQGFLSQAPRRSLFLQYSTTSAGAELRLDLRLLDIVFADTKDRESLWLASENQRLELQLEKLGITMTERHEN